MTNKSENADIRELQTNMVNLNKQFADFKDHDFKDLKEDVKAIIEKLNERADLQLEVDTLKEEVHELKRKKTFFSFAIPIACSVLASILTFLIISFITPATSGSTSTTSTTTTQK